jgi:PAS domain S-box-containing protein
MDSASILIVEDESIIAMDLKTSLLSMGYQVCGIAESGERAIEQAEQHKPDIVLMDIRIRGKKDGIEIADIIRTRFGISIVFITAYLDEEKLARAKLTTPFGYILKPIREKELKVTIDMALYVGKADRERKRTEKELEEREEKYRQIFENAQAPYVETSNDGIILEISPSVNRYLQYTREELIGTSILELYADPDSRDMFVERLLTFGEIVDEEVRVKDKDGSIRYAMLCSKLVPRGKKIIASLQDITARKKAERDLRDAHDELEKKVDLRTLELKEVNAELRVKIRELEHTQNALQHSEAKFRSLVESTSDWVWEVDKDFKFTYSSPSVKDLIEMEASEIYGKTPYDFVYPENRGEWVALFRDFAKSGKRFFRFEIAVPHKNGKDVFLESSGVTILNELGIAEGFRGIVRDVTLRNAIEKQLKISQEKAEAANAAKSQFLANISHELRTPMHHIINYSKYGVEKIDKVDRSKLHHYFSQIRTSGGRLLTLLNDLLDLSKLESSQPWYEYAPTDLVSIAERLILEFKDVTSEKSIRFNLITHYPVTIAFCDEMKIEQVFRNLFSNAIKFTPEGSPITVSFDRYDLTGQKSQSDEKTVPASLVRIIDEGSGIPEDELEIIFDKFIQSSRTRSNAGGTGLGLSICHEIVKAHKGRIWAEHNSVGGATFCFALPISEPVF